MCRLGSHRFYHNSFASSTQAPYRPQETHCAPSLVGRTEQQKVHIIRHTNDRAILIEVQKEKKFLIFVFVHKNKTKAFIRPNDPIPTT
ncbi:hypothetical protein CDAR_417011 [Caerostris darwini]|uniref:Uncharacterized protein n=1 Tax=Caerostris darwini TaxID=1538125 RepID=A0AAV4X814_9ARAC|nr:hypothetical protein CDAR_417011 [Caerostris darwini]